MYLSFLQSKYAIYPEITASVIFKKGITESEQQYVHDTQQIIY